MQHAVRITLFLIPLKVYISLYTAGAIGIAVQNTLDILPETIVILTYILILLSWIELFHKSWSLKRMKDSSWKRISPTALAFVIIAAVAALCIALMSIIIWAVNLSGRYEIVVTIQGIVTGVATFLSTAVFVIYFICLQRMFARLKLNKNSEVYNVLKKISLMGVIFFVSLIIRTIYILVLNSEITALYRSHKFDSKSFAVIWSAYFIVTELVPFSLITFVLIRYVFYSIGGG
eukprot:GEZU01025606.1.p1 GENE.GEZU01025606.1~~GEZU01025606.1.p1  ORF type:complete len:233 (+),score=24.32 GEZU01025606.1:1-699(+)